MIEKGHPKLSVRSQCTLVDVNRNRLKPRQTKITEQDELIMKDLDEIYTKWPFYSQRKLGRELLKYGWSIGRKRTRRLMKIMGIEALVPKPSLSQPTRITKFTPTSYASSRSPKWTKSGAPTSPTSPWKKVTPTSSPHGLEESRRLKLGTQQHNG